jgi:hypothetical protein
MTGKLVKCRSCKKKSPRMPNPVPIAEKLIRRSQFFGLKPYLAVPEK